MPRDALLWEPMVEGNQQEWALQRDMQERGRRLRELARKTEGMALTEVKPGEWRYMPILRGSDA